MSSREEAITDSVVIDGLSVRYLKIFGLWRAINDARTTGKKNIFIKFQTVSIVFLMTPYIFFQCLSYFLTNVDIEKATFLSLHLLAASQVCCKILVFWFRMDRLCRLFNLIKNDFLKSIPDYKRPEGRYIYKIITRRSNILCMTAFIVNTSIIIVYIADPGISVDYIAHHTGSMLAVTGGKKKILGGWYPVPMAEFPYYEIIFVYEVVLMGWGGLLLAVYDCLFYQVLMSLYAQFTVLGRHISTLKVQKFRDRKRENKTKAEENSSIYKELYAILQDHKRILSYANEVRTIYNPLVTMILGMGIFVLCISVYQFLFGARGSPMYLFRSFQYVAYQGVEVSMFCFGSSLIESASSDLQFAIYSSDWYKADTKFRKTAQMLMLGARKGVTLTAIKMYPVNLETIMAILQFTYSVAALMSRMS